MNTTFFLHSNLMQQSFEMPKPSCEDYSLYFIVTWIFMLADCIGFFLWSRGIEGEIASIKRRTEDAWKSIDEISETVFNNPRIDAILDIIQVYAEEKKRVCKEDIAVLEHNITVYKDVSDMLKDIEYVPLGQIQKRDAAIEYLKDSFPGLPICNIVKVFFYKPAHIKEQIAERSRLNVKKILEQEETLLGKQREILAKFHKMRLALESETLY
jgi:hypothetical protein